MAISFVSWNLNGGTFAGRAQRGGNTAAEGLDYVARTLAALSADIVALQELPSGHRDNGVLDAAFEQLREYRFRTVHPVSPSPVETADRIGLAVLSKHEIVDSQLTKLPAPPLMFAGEDGRTQPLHDKAVLTANVRAPGGDISVLCTHLYPFKAQRRRPGELVFEQLRQSFRDVLERTATGPLVICADLNMDSLDDLIPGVAAAYSLSDLITVPTHWVRGGLVRSDHIISTRHFVLDYSRTIPSKFDHHLCFAMLGRQGDPDRARRSSKPRTSNDDFTILHLSDLHYGEGSQSDVDWKVWLDGTERAQRVNRLPTYIRNLPACPDFLVVSGDITIAGNPAGFAEFETTLLSGSRDLRLPDARHIVIVPGNHDVSRSEQPRAEKRWESFQTHFGSRFVVPWLPIHPDPERILDQLKARALESLQMIGGAEQVTDPRTGLTETPSLPFTFDRRKKVLLYAFNSSLIAGTRISSGKMLEKFLDSLHEVGQAPPNYDELVKELNGLRSVDPSRIEPTELTLFHGIVEILRRRLPDEYQHSLKIAVLHHHVVPFIPEEVKQFELLLNAGQFKKQLMDAGFRIVIHGHKHWADMVVDSALPEGGELVVVSGGTIGGGPSKGKAGFNWLLFERNANVTYVRRHFIPVTSDSAEDAIAGLDAPEQTKALRRGRPAPSVQPQATSFLAISRAVEDSLVRYLVKANRRRPATGHSRVGTITWGKRASASWARRSAA